jgi:hypothetical protein
MESNQGRRRLSSKEGPVTTINIMKIHSVDSSMLTRDQAGDIFDKLRSYAAADEIELLISGGRSALTRFANNTIHQNVEEEISHVSVRVSFGGRTARATSNKHDEESLRRVVQSAEALARVQQPDPELLPMPTPAEVKENAADAGAIPVRRRFDSTARISPSGSCRRRGADG